MVRLQKLPLTVAYIRDELRQHKYSGDLFEALEYLLTQYDELWEDYKALNNKNMKEYTVTRG